MIFEWDEKKAARNSAKHGVLFPYVVRVFLDPQRLDAEDARRDYGEQRRCTLGEIDGRLFAVVYTIRDAAIRIISAQKVNDRERRQYDETLST